MKGRWIVNIAEIVSEDSLILFNEDIANFEKALFLSIKVNNLNDWYKPYRKGIDEKYITENIGR
ncbi:MAG TPA: hypothetical protein PKU78_03915 [Candidatus Dojkabacteria bacterium]|nr:hypothetical protein [Candidatus Dojkabacteria bacterium]